MSVLVWWCVFTYMTNVNDLVNAAPSYCMPLLPTKSVGGYEELAPCLLPLGKYSFHMGDTGLHLWDLVLH